MYKNVFHRYLKSTHKGEVSVSLYEKIVFLGSVNMRPDRNTLWAL